MRLFASLVVVLGLSLVSSHADAQVFKPKGGAKTEKKAAKSPAKKKVTTKKAKATKKKKKSAAAERSRPDDLTPEPDSTGEDEDFVKITDDDEIE